MYNKRQSKTKTHRRHRGGAIYSFNLNDKIGGLPSRIPLNGTADGDCPATDTAELGFVNYDITRPTRGGGRRFRRTGRSKNSTNKVSPKSRKTKRNLRK